MKFNNPKRNSKTVLLYLLTFAIAAASFSVFFAAAPKIAPAVSAQQDLFSAQRINQIEQRFNLIESRLTRLETESRRQTPTIALRTDENDRIESELLRVELEALRLRLAAVECGLLKLDERTLPSSVREARKKSVAADGSSDQCRLDPNAPLQILSRP